MSSRLVFAALQRQLATQLIIDDDNQLEQNFEAMQLQFQVAEKSAPHLFGLGTFYLERKKDDEGCCGCCYSSKKEPMFSLITDSGSLAQLQAFAQSKTPMRNILTKAAAELGVNDDFAVAAAAAEAAASRVAQMGAERRNSLEMVQPFRPKGVSLLRHDMDQLTGGDKALGEEPIQRDLGMEDITSFAEETKLRALGGTRASILDGMCQRQTLQPHGTRF